MKFGLILFGIPRSLKWTCRSIRENVIRPFEKLGEVETYGHFNFTDVVESRDSDDSHAMPALDISGLKIQHLVIEDQRRHNLDRHAAFIEKHDLASSDDRDSRERTNINFVRGLESLSRAWTLCEENSSDIDLYIFARPDLYYRDEWPAEAIVEQILGEVSDIVVPGWHSWGGVNDRFAVANGRAAKSYAKRLEALSMLMKPGRPMNSEGFLAEALAADQIKVGTFEAFAHRVRSDGRILRDGQAYNLELLWKRLSWQILPWFPSK